MKKFLIALGLVSVLLATGLAIFIATFDADRYRPLVVQELERAVGQPVRFQRLSLGWQGGIAIRLEGVAIDEDRQAQGEPLLQAESVGALVRLGPLLRREVRVASVLLRRPRIRVTRDAQGRINLTGLAAAASPAAASGHTATMGGSPVSFQIASLRIEDGAVHWIDATTQPPTDLRLQSLDATVSNITSGRPMNIEAKGALASSTQNVHVSGRITPPSPPHHDGSLDELSLAVADLPIDQLAPAARPEEPRLDGALTLRIAGRVPSLEPSGLLRVASGNGRIAVEHPVMRNLNILRRVFEQLSMLPGVVERLEARLPPEYQAKLAARDTVLSPIDLSLQLEGGTLRFDQLEVRSDTFRLAGAGQMGVDGSILIRSRLYIEPTLSAALVKSVNELAALTNTAGEMELPLTIQGRAPQVAVLTDLGYVASKVVTRKAADLLEGLLERSSDQPDTPPQDQETEPPAPERDLLGTILQRALQQRAPSSDAPPQ